jgi:uncharacterized protein YnzC (UPF0291/DUF896 family)
LKKSKAFAVTNNENFESCEIRKRIICNFRKTVMFSLSHRQCTNKELVKFFDNYPGNFQTPSKRDFQEYKGN